MMHQALLLSSKPSEHSSLLDSSPSTDQSNSIGMAVKKPVSLEPSTLLQIISPRESKYPEF